MRGEIVCWNWSIWYDKRVYDVKRTKLKFVEIIWLSLVAFQLWGALEQLVPEIFLNYFFKTGDLSMVQLTQNMQKNSKKWKNAKNALTSHYANGHGDPCDKWVKNQLIASTGHQVNFLKVLRFFHTSQHGKIPKSKVI